MDTEFIEEMAFVQFGQKLAVKQMIVRDIPVSHTATATMFLTPKQQLFVAIRAQSVLTFGDVHKIARRMGLVVDTFLPPGRDSAYFNRIAREKFRRVFPGRHDISEDELRYYRTLVPYNPALLRIKSINGGVVKQFDSRDSAEWRPATTFVYTQITTKVQ